MSQEGNLLRLALDPEDLNVGYEPTDVYGAYGASGASVAGGGTPDFMSIVRRYGGAMSSDVQVYCTSDCESENEDTWIQLSDTEADTEAVAEPAETVQVVEDTHSDAQGTTNLFEVVATQNGTSNLFEVVDVRDERV